MLLVLVASMLVAAPLVAEPGLADYARELQPQTAAQVATFRSMLPELAYSGRRFGGKSWTGCAKAMLYAGLYPGAHVGVFREERASMEGTTLRTLREEILPRGLWEQCWRESKSTLFLPNGSEVAVFGLDRPGRALGTRYGFAFGDQAEQLDRNQFEIINSSLMQVGMPWHQLMLGFNPEGPEHWAFRRYAPDLGDGVRRDKSGVPFAEVVHVLPDDLLGYLTPEALRRFDRMEGSWRDRLRLGLWVAFEGAVYTTWNAGLHVRSAPASWARWGGYPPPAWERIRGIDLGYEPDPFAAAWLARSPAGEWILYRQCGGLRVTADRWAVRMVEAEARELETLRERARELPKEEQADAAPYLAALNLTGSWCDHARGERAILEEHGIWSQPAVKDITAGVQTLLALMDPRDGGPRLSVVEGGCERDPLLLEAGRPASFEEEVPLARWNDELVNGARRQLPVDRNNHWLDAVRYALHSRTAQVEARIWA